MKCSSKRLWFVPPLLLIGAICLFLNPAFGQPPSKAQTPSESSASKDSLADLNRSVPPNPLFKSTQTIKYSIDPQTGEAKPITSEPKPERKDTVIVIRKGLTPQQLKQKNEAEMAARKKTQFCDCMTMEIKAPQDIRYADYLNYSFIFRNRCEEPLWVQSSEFGFSVHRTNGQSAKTLRSLNFSKQYKYPEWVEISPENDFEFQFADDPFFRYELQSGDEYIFRFRYLPPPAKSSKTSSRATACPKTMEQKIRIR